MKKQLFSTLLAFSIPLASYALPHHENTYGLQFDKSHKTDNQAPALNSNKAENARIKAIIADEKMKFKVQIRPEKSRIKGELNKDQLGRLEELYQQHNFVQAFIAGGYVRQ
jgi:uncharacterized protein YajQ (UPF0234 family)